MPTYDYRCDACGHTFELFQMMSEAPKRKCPACAKAKLVRLIGPGAGILFKGSGFYTTDYRSDSYKKAQAAESKPDSPAPKDGGSSSSAASSSSASPSSASSGSAA